MNASRHLLSRNNVVCSFLELYGGFIVDGFPTDTLKNIVFLFCTGHRGLRRHVTREHGCEGKTLRPVQLGEFRERG